MDILLQQTAESYLLAHASLSKLTRPGLYLANYGHHAIKEELAKFCYVWASFCQLSRRSSLRATNVCHFCGQNIRFLTSRSATAERPRCRVG